VLSLAGSDAPLQGSATLRDIPLDGWISLLGFGDNLPLRKITATGDVVISGTAARPALRGTLTMHAGEALLFGANRLDSLNLPISLGSGTATLSDGSALYRGRPVDVSGTAGWPAPEGPFRAELKLAGTDLPVTLAPGIETVGKADLRLLLTGTEGTLLEGSVTLAPAPVDLRPTLLPSFFPPGIPLPPPAIPSRNGLTDRIDLAVSSTKTEGTVDDGAPRVEADFRLKGSLSNPRPEGTVTVFNQSLILPCGLFFLPTARLELGSGATRLQGAGACGLTRAGPCLLLLSGVASSPRVVMEGPETMPAADLLLELETRSPQTAPSPDQTLSWLRQSALLPLPPLGWVTGNLGDPDPSSLGFHGAPWIWNLFPSSSGTQRPQAR
jgi:hypothetical protein